MSPARHLALVQRDDDPSEPVDPDFTLICDYLMKALSMRDAERVEQRLVEDKEFFDKVWPILRVWQLPRNVRARRQRARERAAIHAALSSRVAAPPPPSAREFAPPVHRSRRRWLTLGEGTVKMISNAFAASLILSAGFLGYTRYIADPHPPTKIIYPRAPVTRIAQGVQIETSVGETKDIPLRGGSHVLLRPNSRFTFGYLHGPGVAGLSAALDGEMAVEVTRGDFIISLVTASGQVMLTPGNYAVRCELGCAAMLVTVGTGRAFLRADSAKTGGLELRSGEKGMVPKHGQPEKVTPGDKWPALEPAKVP